MGTVFLLILGLIIFVTYKFGKEKSGDNIEQKTNDKDRFYFDRDCQFLIDEGVKIPAKVMKDANRHELYLIEKVYKYVTKVWAKTNPDQEMTVNSKNELTFFILRDNKLTSIIWDYQDCRENTKGFRAVQNIINGNRKDYFQNIPKENKKEIPIQKKGGRLRLKDALFYSENKQTITIEYQRRTKDWKWEKTVRDIDIYFPEQGYLYAYCHFRKEPRVFHRESVVRWEAKENVFEKDGEMEKYLRAKQDRRFRGTYNEWLASRNEKG